MLLSMIIILLVLAAFVYMLGLEDTLAGAIAMVGVAIVVLLFVLIAGFRYILAALLIILCFYLITHYHLGVLPNG